MEDQSLNSAPDGMTIEQARLVWEGAADLFTDEELTAILTDAIVSATAFAPTAIEPICMLDGTHPHAPMVFKVVRALAKACPQITIDDRDDYIILSKLLWTQLTHRLLVIFVTSGAAPTSLEELLLTEGR